LVSMADADARAAASGARAFASLASRRHRETIFLAAWRFRPGVYLFVRGNSPFHGA